MTAVLVPLRAFAPDIANLSPKAFRVHGRALVLSCMNSTDGLLTPADIETVGATPAVTKELLEAGVWQRDEQGRTFVRELRDRPAPPEADGGEVRHGETAGARRTREWRERQGSIPPSQRPSRGDATERHGDADQSVTVTPAVTEKSVTESVTSVTPVPPAPPSGLDSDPDSSGVSGSSSASSSDPKDGSGGARGAKRGPNKTPVPEPFPVESVLVYGRSKGLCDAEIASECEGLVLWAKGKGERKADWIATAQGWLRRRAIEMGRRAPVVDLARRQREKAAAERALAEQTRRELSSGPAMAPEQARALVQGVLAGTQGPKERVS